MIEGMSGNKQDSIINEMRKTDNHVFHLTGSRFFGFSTDASDFDFFAQDSTSIRVYLEKIGFKLYHDTDYVDSLTVGVYRHHCGVDVQLTSNCTLKQRAQNILKKSPVLSQYQVRLNKQLASAIWQVVIDSLEDGIRINRMFTEKEEVE